MRLMRNDGSYKKRLGQIRMSYDWSSNKQKLCAFDFCRLFCYNHFNVEGDYNDVEGDYIC